MDRERAPTKRSGATRATPRAGRGRAGSLNLESRLWGKDMGFEGVATREDRQKGFFVSFDYTGNALRQIDGFFRKSAKVVIALTAARFPMRRSAGSWRERRA